MKATLHNRHGIEVAGKTFPAGTDLMSAALVLFTSIRKTTDTVPCTHGSDYLGAFVLCETYKARKSK
jgi:hypothetical protein